MTHSSGCRERFDPRYAQIVEKLGKSGPRLRHCRGCARSNAALAELRAAQRMLSASHPERRFYRFPRWIASEFRADIGDYAAMRRKYAEKA